MHIPNQIFDAFTLAGTGTAIASLSGAAATSATISALGGVDVITGGSALIAVGASYAAWHFIQAYKNDPNRTLKQLEEKLYTDMP